MNLQLEAALLGRNFDPLLIPLESAESPCHYSSDRVKALTRIAQADLVTLTVLENRASLRPAASEGAARLEPPETISLHQSIVGKAYEQREPVIANN